MHCLPVCDAGISGPGASRMSNFRVIWVVRGLILLNASAAIGIVKNLMEVYL